MKPTPLTSPLPGEHLVAVWPTPKPDDSSSAPKRLNFWAGRSLTADALQLEQENRTGRLARRAQLATSGIVRGLEVALERLDTASDELKLEDHFIHVLPGSGVTAYGEDVLVPRALRIALSNLELLNSASEAADPIPWAAVLILRPAELRAFAKTDVNDPCELDLSRDAFSDERRLEVSLLSLFVLPSAWAGLDALKNPGDLTWRNRLASFLLTSEAAGSPRQQIVRTEKDGAISWQIVPGNSDVPPWEAKGVPLALLSTETIPGGTQKRFFLDRNSVVRSGALPHPRSRPTVGVAIDLVEPAENPGAGTPGLWRARVDQFAEQISGYLAETPAAQAAHFRFLPPAGLLPRTALKFLNTADAILTQPIADGAPPPDRADESPFFPASFAVQAVPVAVEDLDAALASSAPLTPFDLTAPQDEVRVLVPIPQKVFDPKLLVVELPDPLFQVETNRLAAVRQDWRERRDFVLQRSTELTKQITGAKGLGSADGTSTGNPDTTAPTLVSAINLGQNSVQLIFSKPVSAATALLPANYQISPGVTVTAVSAGLDSWTVVLATSPLTFGTAYRVSVSHVQDRAPVPNMIPDGAQISFTALQYVPPPVTSAKLEDDSKLEDAEAVQNPANFRNSLMLSPVSNSGNLTVTLNRSIGLARTTTLGLVLQVDIENPPEEVFLTFVAGGKTYTKTWTLDDFPKRKIIQNPSDPAPAFALWQIVDVALASLGFDEGGMSSFTVNVAGGRIALVGLLSNGQYAWWVDKPLDDLDPEYSVGTTGDWTKVTSRSDVPFENRYAVTFLDKTLDQRTRELNDAILPQAATVVGTPVSVAQNGFRTAITTLDSFANQADDFVDAHFTRAQTNLYRVRKLILGETAAQKLLVSPTIATIAEQQTASASAEKLNTFLAQAKLKKIEVGLVKEALQGPIQVRFSGVMAAAVAPNPIVERISPEALRTESTNIFVDKAATKFLISDVAKNFTAPDPLGQVRGDRPETGPTLPPRGLSIGKRFEEPTATLNLSYARGALKEVVDQLPKLSLLLSGKVKSLDGTTEIELLELQGRKIGGSADAAKAKLFTLPTSIGDGATTDEAEVTLAALDMIEMKSTLLRAIEQVVTERRATLDLARETLAALQAKAAEAQARVDQLQAKLIEARQDVAVARALWKEELTRVDAINVRRDNLLANEVKFLAYLRPRTIDPVRRDFVWWRIESADSPAPVPACLRQHDEPPDPLHAYVQLFRHATIAWFPEMARQVDQLDTREKLAGLLLSTTRTAARFVASPPTVTFRTGYSPAILTAFQSSFSLVQTTRQLAMSAAALQPATWLQQKQHAQTQSSLGDLIDGAHGQTRLAAAASAFLDQIEQVATCLHAEFAAVPPATRLRWVERYSQYDQPADLRDLTALPGYGSLPRDQRRRFQDFVNWLFGRVNASDSGALSLINDLVRICLLLASQAPVNQIITGHLPRPTPVRPGALIPIVPANPLLVRAGMEFHVWRGSTVVAQGHVEDLGEQEVSARVSTSEIATLDSTMRVQFIPAALGLIRSKSAQ